MKIDNFFAELKRRNVYKVAVVLIRTRPKRNQLFFREFMLPVAMSACGCGLSANMNSLIEQTDKMGPEGVRPSRNHPALSLFLFELSRK